jgi:hypothetical protein
MCLEQHLSCSWRSSCCVYWLQNVFLSSAVNDSFWEL